MPPLELQRLIARGAGSLPELVVVDVGALLRVHSDGDRPNGVLEQVLRAIRRGCRRALVVCAPSCTGEFGASLERQSTECSPFVDSDAVIESTQPLVGLFAAAKQTGFAVISCDLADHPWDLAVLDAGCEAVLDVATGKVWTTANVERAYCAPKVLALFATISGLGTDVRPIVKEANSTQNRERLRETLRHGAYDSLESVVAASDFPARVKRELAAHSARLHDRLRQLQACEPVDQKALDFVQCFIDAPISHSVDRASDLLRPFVVADVDTPAGARNTFKRIAIVRGSSRRPDVVEAAGHDACVDLLRWVPSNQTWCAPRAIDLLGAMVDAQIQLPAAIVDPGFDLFLLDPDDPPSLGDIVPVAHSLDAVTMRWVSDPKRLSRAPRTLRPLALLLEQIDSALAAKITVEGLAQIRADFAYTLPVAVWATCNGFWRCPPAMGWDALQQKMREFVEEKMQNASPLLHHLPNSYLSDAKDLRAVSDRLHPLPRDCTPKGFPPPSAKQMFARHAFHFPDAKALAELRSLQSKPGALGWFWRLVNPAQVRGRLRIQRTGRIGLANVPLQSLPKNGPFAMELRQTLRAPDGYLLVGADFAAFEARIIAHISQDPVLLWAARTTGADLHQLIAHKLGATREEAKQGIYALGYGQKLAGFINSQTAMTVTRATELYHSMRSLLDVAFEYANQVQRAFKNERVVTTLGGWRRYPEKPRDAFNSLVQGTGADIFRFLLRDLAIKLPSHGAHVVHVVHDEVVVMCPNARDTIENVVRTVKDSMEHAGQASNLIPDSFLLLAVKGPKVGLTLADLL